ncbi:hypothetical protein MHYP_G00082110 [Metynnis hypsauchen]
MGYDSVISRKNTQETAKLSQQFFNNLKIENVKKRMRLINEQRLIKVQGRCILSLSQSFQNTCQTELRFSAVEMSRGKGDKLPQKRHASSISAQQ